MLEGNLLKGEMLGHAGVVEGEIGNVWSCIIVHMYEVTKE